MTIKEIIVNIFIRYMDFSSQNCEDIKEIQLENGKYLIQERFDSKKNQAFLVKLDTLENNRQNRQFVIKIYNEENKSKSKTEITTIIQLSDLGISVPRVKEYSNYYLLMEYIPGKTLLQIIDEVIKSNSPMVKKDQDLNSIIEQLSNWFFKLHYYTFESSVKGSSLLKGDCTMKNFIVDERSQMIYGVDFEESRRDEPVIDIGSVCAAILTIKPMFSKLDFDLCRQFVQSYRECLLKMMTIKKDSKNNLLKLDNDSVIQATLQALRYRAKWMSKAHLENISTWCEQIQQTGILNLDKP